MEATTTGIQTYPLELVPAVTLTVEPKQVMVPVETGGDADETIRAGALSRHDATKVSVGLDAPKGWTVQTRICRAAGICEGRRPVDSLCGDGAGGNCGGRLLRCIRTRGWATKLFARRVEPIPTLPTRNWSEPADATVHVLDLMVPAGLRIGYIAAENDTLPEILRQIGIRVDMLDEVALAFGDLSKYDAITVGIRAYELRPDLLRTNARLLDYVKRGGTLLVQYQRDFAWNKRLPAPFKAKMPE